MRRARGIMIFRNRPRDLAQLRADPDEVLCCEILKGNHEAFLVLFDRYWRDVYRLAYSGIREERQHRQVEPWRRPQLWGPHRPWFLWMHFRSSESRAQRIPPSTGAVQTGNCPW